MSTPLLSICIPTYNRSKYLKRALEAYVSNAAFDENVEIVISDNNSSDETNLICESFTKRFNNIKYFKNKENVKDANFALALDRGNGLYVKLMNDNNVITDSGLAYLKDVILQHKDKREQLFFSNGIIFNHEKTIEAKCNSFGEFVLNLSYYVTAIHVFGTWKADWEKIKDKTRFSHLQLAQDDWAYQLVERKGYCFLCTGEYFLCQSVGTRGGYNWIKVHIDNYYEILQCYVNKGLVTRRELMVEKSTHLFMMKSNIFKAFSNYLLRTNRFTYDGALGILFKRFWRVPYFYGLLLSSPYKFAKGLISSFSKKV